MALQGLTDWWKTIRAPSVQALENKTIIQSVPVPHVKVRNHLQAGVVQKARKNHLVAGPFQHFS